MDFKTAVVELKTTYAAVARFLGVHRSTPAKWASGENEMSRPIAKRIADFLNCRLVLSDSGKAFRFIQKVK